MLAWIRRMRAKVVAAIIMEDEWGEVSRLDVMDGLSAPVRDRDSVE